MFSFIIERLTIDRYVHFDNQELKLKVRDSPFEVMIQSNLTDLVQTSILVPMNVMSNLNKIVIDFEKVDNFVNFHLFLLIRRRFYLSFGFNSYIDTRRPYMYL